MARSRQHQLITDLLGWTFVVLLSASFFAMATEIGGVLSHDIGESKCSIFSMGVMEVRISGEEVVRYPYGFVVECDGKKRQTTNPWRDYDIETPWGEMKIGTLYQCIRKRTFIFGNTLHTGCKAV